jgi:subtilisin family serine protease
MQQAPIDIEIPDEDRLGQIDIDTFREQLYARIDRNRNNVHDDLDSKISSGTITEWVRTIITCKRGSLPGIRTYLEESGGHIFEVWKPVEGFYGLAANVSAEKISSFGQHSDIEMIEESMPTLRFADDATRLTQLRTHVWDTLGYTGANNNSIAILDTGLDDSHPILNGYGDKAFGKSGYKIVGWYDATSDGAGSPEDYQGHGSHCGGIAAGLPYNATVSLADSRIKTTWSYHYLHSGGSATGYIPYAIDVRSTGTVDISYYWDGRGQNRGIDLALIAPNRTEIARNDTGDNPMTISVVVTDTGLYSVRLGLQVGLNGEISLIGTNRYPYEDLGDDNSRVSGVAPDTKLVGIKTFDRSGTGWDYNVVSGLNWLINNAEDYHVTIASMSIGFSATISSVNTQIIMLWNKGILPVISAGNDGQGDGNKIYSPGEVDSSLTVAASGDYNQITAYSSQGPGNCTENSTTIKPDVAAPGGVSSQGAYLQVDSGDSDADNGYESIPTISDKQSDDLTAIQGTSMATPHVAGIAALMVQAMGGNSSWAYDDATKIARIKQVLMLTTYEIYGNERGGKDDVEGYGRVSADAALEALIYTYSVGTTASASLDADRFGKKVWARNVTFIEGNSCSFTCDVPEGLDYDIFLYYPSPTIHGEPRLVAKSTNPTPGGQERFTYTANTTGYYYLAIKYVSGFGSGIFSLKSESGTNYPSVRVISPSDGSNHSDQLIIQVSAAATSPATVSRVIVVWATDAWVDITNGYNAISTYYEATINTSQLLDGNYGFFAAVIDSNGKITYNVSYVSISNVPPQVLLVDDDGGATYETYYKAALESLGISYDSTSSPPNSATMAGYGTVVWLTGDDYTDTLDTTDQAELETYLSGGGNLFISGQDIGLNLGASNSFLNNYLKADYGGFDDSGGTAVSGQTSSLFESQSYSLGGGDGADNNNYPDAITALSGGILALEYNDDNTRGACVTHNGSWKSVYFAFAYESISSASERYKAMQAIMDFLHSPPTVNITSPTASVVQGAFTLEWTAKDDTSVSYCHVFQSGEDKGITTGLSMDFDIASDRMYTIRVVAYDSALKKTIDTYTFAVDNTPPTITLNSPANESINPGGTLIDISFDGTEVAYNYSWDGGLTNFTITPELPYAEGEYWLDVFTKDVAGNWNHKRFLFYSEAPIPEFPNDLAVGLLFTPILILTRFLTRRKTIWAKTS